MINNHKRTIAAILSGIVFIVFIMLVEWINLGNPNNITIGAILSSSLFSLAYTFIVRDAEWRLGIWTSFAYWAYLSLVSLTLLLNHQPEWWPLTEAFIIIAMACLAVQFGKLIMKTTPWFSHAR